MKSSKGAEWKPDTQTDPLKLKKIVQHMWLSYATATPAAFDSLGVTILSPASGILIRFMYTPYPPF